MSSIRRTVAFVAAIVLLSFDRSAAAAPRANAATLAAVAIKHVFIIVQENHTFDNYFGLYPGGHGQVVENLASTAARANDCLPDPETGGCQRPFLITTDASSPNYVADAPDISGGNNNRSDQLASIDRGAMDGFLRDNEGANALLLPTDPTDAQVRAHNASLSIEATYDCNTVPYLWYYAKNFTLFDQYFQANAGQSTPGNIQLFAGQTGQTEAATGNAPITTVLASGRYSDGVPITNDHNPPAPVTAAIPAYKSPDEATVQSYATMPVLLNPEQDRQSTAIGNVGMIAQDLSLEGASGRASVPWAWYEEGLFSSAADLVQHHDAPLYFDYINHPNSPFGTTATMRDNTPSNGLVSDIASGSLAATGVYWVKGGNANQFGLVPADAALAKAGKFLGDDDHPGSGDSDHQVAETYVATLIDAIAQSSYWKDSAIILTWDDSGGLYDHVAPRPFGAVCPQDRIGPRAGSACGDGMRLPLLVISPFSKTGVVVHDRSDAGSVSKFLETVFALPTFASLPDEAAGVRAGLAPADANAAISDLTGALDANKLSGATPPNARATATIASPSVTPAMNCATLGITPVASPSRLPPGYRTLGSYVRAASRGDAAARVRLRAPRDDDD